MSDWMYAHTLPIEDHPHGCTCGGCYSPSDAELEAEAPGVFADPYKAAFFMLLAMVSCPNCRGVEFRTEDRIDGEVDGVCLDCGHIWRVGKVELGDDEAADDARRAVENGGYE